MTEGCVPPGKRHNPSSWFRRVPLIALALVGSGIATYMAAYQAAAIPGVWDPVFGRGSEVILTSWVSRSLPIPDAALGAVPYLLDAVTGAMGGQGRWRTMPWIVLLFGLIVAGLTTASMFLVIAQPLLFHTGCTLCLVSAAISFTSAWFARDEVQASLQSRSQARAPGHGRRMESSCTRRTAA